MGLEGELRKETEKWAGRIEKEMKKAKPRDQESERFLSNIRAYIKDSKYFLEKGDLVRGFEAIVWAWAWLQILKETGFLE
ncbi:MAG: DUF357 domain-containing protein [Candidatus Aenigmatarchaeota archaeon]|nr:MAG: DUF357 domain-containing protein [Candidatus Aenigmarchaeota archaeon]